MFINSKKTYEFSHPDGLGKVTTIPAEYLGPVADWITETKLFELAVKEGSITIAEHNKTIPGAPAISKEERVLRDKARTLGIACADELPLVGLALQVYEAENSLPCNNEGVDDRKHPADDSGAPDNTADLVKQLETMGADALKAYAAQNNITIGNATSENGLRKKILETLN